MREIKFRAFDKIKKAMFANLTDLFFENSPQGIYKASFMSSFGDSIDVNGEDCIFMQYTGKKDRNKKEIYEGDIIKQFNIIFSIDDKPIDLIGEVYWCEQDASFMVAFNSVEQIGKITSTMEVIGNIYENKELLGQ